MHSGLLFSLVDCFLVAVAPVSVSMSPTGDFLATAHVDHLGVFLWSEPIPVHAEAFVNAFQPITVVFSLRTNKSLCGPVGLRPLPADYQPAEETIPGINAEDEDLEVPSEEADDVYQSAEQLGAELVTLSLLPESRWKSLLHLDDIKVVWRNVPPVSLRVGLSSQVCLFSETEQAYGAPHPSALCPFLPAHTSWSDTSIQLTCNS